MHKKGLSLSKFWNMTPKAQTKGKIVLSQIQILYASENSMSK